MNVFTSPQALRAALPRDRRIALVPTMGCLHAGHACLIREARRSADFVAVSIYVNPLQFGPNEDFARYPRTPEEDRRLCAEAGADALFCPETLYPAGRPLVSLKVAGLSDCLCGMSRPGHFDGVATVVNILCNIVRPDAAFFGEKDYQQFLIVKRMAVDLQMAVEMRMVPTVREADGLALSSRNRYLSEDERRRAPELHAALCSLRAARASGQSDAQSLTADARKRLKDAGMAVEYLEIRDEETLEPADMAGSRPVRVFAAVRLGTTRLIDNLPLEDACA